MDNYEELVAVFAPLSKDLHPEDDAVDKCSEIWGQKTEELHQEVMPKRADPRQNMQQMQRRVESMLEKFQSYTIQALVEQREEELDMVKTLVKLELRRFADLIDEFTSHGVVEGAIVAASDVAVADNVATYDVAVADNVATSDVTVTSNVATSDVAVTSNVATLDVVVTSKVATSNVAITYDVSVTAYVAASEVAITVDVAICNVPVSEEATSEVATSDVAVVANVAASEVAAYEVAITADVGISNVPVSEEATSDVATSDVAMVANVAASEVAAPKVAVTANVAISDIATMVATANVAVANDLANVAVSVGAEVAVATEVAATKSLISPTMCTREVQPFPQLPHGYAYTTSYGEIEHAITNHPITSCRHATFTTPPILIESKMIEYTLSFSFNNTGILKVDVTVYRTEPAHDRWPVQIFGYGLVYDPTSRTLTKLWNLRKVQCWEPFDESGVKISVPVCLTSSHGTRSRTVSHQELVDRQYICNNRLVVRWWVGCYSSKK